MKHLISCCLLLLGGTVFAQDAAPLSPPARWQHGLSWGLDFGHTRKPDWGNIRSGFCRWGNSVLCPDVPTRRSPTVVGLTAGYQLLRVRNRLAYGGTAEVMRLHGNGPQQLLGLSGVVEFSGSQLRVRPFVRAQLGGLTSLGLGGGNVRGVPLGLVAQPSAGLSFGRQARFSFDVGYRYSQLNYDRERAWREDSRIRLDYHRWTTRLIFRL